MKPLRRKHFKSPKTRTKQDIKQVTKQANKQGGRAGPPLSVRLFVKRYVPRFVNPTEKLLHTLRHHSYSNLKAGFIGRISIRSA